MTKKPTPGSSEQRNKQEILENIRQRLLNLVLSAPQVGNTSFSRRAKLKNAEKCALVPPALQEQQKT